MAKKLPPHVTRTKDGKTRVRYQASKKFPVEYDKIFDTDEEAIKANDEYLAKNTLKLLRKTKSMGFSDFCDYYLDWLRTSKASIGTVRTYRKYCNTLKIAVGNPDINEMDSLFISNILVKESKRENRGNGKKQGSTISGNTLNHEYSMLSILFNKMFDWGFITENPMRSVEEPEFEEKPIEVPEYEELGNIEIKIMSVQNIRNKLQFLIGFYTGMREEEVAAIDIDKDIDRENCIFNVVQVIVQNEHGEYVEVPRPKSKYSKRSLPFPPSLLPILDEYLVYRKSLINIIKSRNPNYIDNHKLFINKDGDFCRPNYISRLWSKFAKSNDIPITFHGLRHYYITNQMNFNPNLSDRDVQALAGHADLRTTQRYNHPSKKRINNNAVDIFNKFDANSIFKNGYDVFTIPIEHIASIIIGKSELSNVSDLKITLEVVTNEKVDYSNISNIIEKCKSLIISKYPALERLIQYKYGNYTNEEILEKIKKQFGKEVQIKK